MRKLVFNREKCPMCAFAQELASQGMRRRAELPQRRVSKGQRGTEGEGGDFVDCQGFVRLGACCVFNKRGRCSNHHPLHAHVVEVPRPRCPQVRTRPLRFCLGVSMQQYFVPVETLKLGKLLFHTARQ